jgi:hypothetical protein
MTPHQVLAVAVRLFAIWLAIYVLRSAPSYYRELTRLGDSTGTAATLVVAGLAIAMVAFLWLFPRTVARTLLDAKSLAPPEPADPDTWFATGCALIGVWLIVPALSALIYDLSIFYLAQRDSRIDVADLQFDWIYRAAEIVLGIWLVMGARGMRKLFWAIRAREQP